MKKLIVLSAIVMATTLTLTSCGDKTKVEPAEGAPVETATDTDTVPVAPDTTAATVTPADTTTVK